MHGEGDRRYCPSCGQSVLHISDMLSHRELRGPRNITSSNIDRVFDDRGRFLFIEEKRDGETMSKGQMLMLQALSRRHDVWVVKGTPEALYVYTVHSDGLDLLEMGDWSLYQRMVDDWFRVGVKSS